MEAQDVVIWDKFEECPVAPKRAFQNQYEYILFFSRAISTHSILIEFVKSSTMRSGGAAIPKVLVTDAHRQTCGVTSFRSQVGEVATNSTCVRSHSDWLRES